MSYQTMIVYMNNPDTAHTLMTAASSLAEQHSAHLTGLYVVPSVEYYVTNDYPVPYDLTNTHRIFHQERAGVLQRIFEEHAANGQFLSDWRCMEDGVTSNADAVSAMANTVDLLILSQSVGSTANHFQRELPELVLLGTSRPVVIIPADPIYNTTGKNVFVAYDGGRESTRATFDSLPQLQVADSVVLHQINPSKYERHHILGTAGEVLKTLSRHQVQAEYEQTHASSAAVGDELLLLAKEKGADLLVMGAYGRRRFREKLFGGTTQTVIENMQIPVMMSC